MNASVLPVDLLRVLVPLADKPPDPSQVGQGLIGFLVFLFLAIATVLLWLSFRRQLKKVNFEEQPDPARGGPATARRTRRRAGPTPGDTTKP
jgi:hypothetical protein